MDMEQMVQWDLVGEKTCPGVTTNPTLFDLSSNLGRPGGKLGTNHVKNDRACVHYVANSFNTKRKVFRLDPILPPAMNTIIFLRVQ
jgi:hypothetical protein